MFAYEVCLIDGSVWFDQGFDTLDDAEIAMSDFIDGLTVSIEYALVREV